jgi:hypothetical protein
MELPGSYPFDKLKLHDGESLLWFACNPTFHRSGDYGIVLTDQAIYLRGWMFSLFFTWKRVPLASIQSARFKDSRWFPRLELVTDRGVTSFHTPHDFHGEEMDFDRKNLVHAACFVEHLRTAPNSSLKRTNQSLRD